MVAAPSDRLVVRGPAAVELFGWFAGKKPPLEVLVEGPAGTGKTRTILEFIRAYVENNANVRVLMMRDTRVDMTTTVLVPWEVEVLGLDHPAVRGGPTRACRDVYRFANGSEVVIGGFNNETKLFSGEYHGIYFNECQQTIEEKWETLHRALRAKGAPFKFFVGDCNPDDEGHWLNLRAETDAMKRVVTRLWDNPFYYDGKEWTEAGKEYATRLRSTLTGANFKRLYEGVWCKYEGLVLPEYDAAIHRIYGRLEQRGESWYLVTDSWTRELRWFVFSKDVGYTKPGCLQVWGVDPEGRTYRVREYYHTGWSHSDWSARVVREAKMFNPQAMVCDHDPAMILAINRALIDAGMSPICQEADKTLGKRNGRRARIELLRSSLLNRTTFLLRDAVQEIDQSLVAKKLPWCTDMEVPRWSLRKYVLGDDATKIADEPDDACDDHGIDAWLYREAYSWGLKVQPRPASAEYPPGTMGRALGHRKHMEKALWK